MYFIPYKVLLNSVKHINYFEFEKIFIILNVHFTEYLGDE